MNFNRILFLVFLIIGFISCSANKGKGLDIEVTFTKDIESHQIPIVINLPKGFGNGHSIIEMTEENSAHASSFYAQRFMSNGSENQKIAFLWKPKKIGESTRLHLKPTAEIPKEVFRFDDDKEKFLHLFENEKPVFRYIYGMFLKEGIAGRYRRSSYIHPVYGLDSEVLSDDFPKVHLHHRGIFWAWPNAIIDGESYNSWAVLGLSVHLEKWLSQKIGPVFARLGMENGWYVDNKKIADETVWITVFRAGKIGRVLDFDLTLEAVDKPITLLGLKEKGCGGFSVRFAPFKKPVITTSDGVQEKDNNMLKFPWADISAMFGKQNKYSGISVFQNKQNIYFPEDYGLRHYGLLNPHFPGLKPFTLNPGKPVSVKYRVWLHRGDAVEGKVISAYTMYGNPPEVKIIE